MGARLANGMKEAASNVGVNWFVSRVGSMFTGFFMAGPVKNYASAKRSDTREFARFFHSMLSHGIYVAPSQFELIFVSLAHGEQQIQQTIEAAQAAFSDLAP